MGVKTMMTIKAAERIAASAALNPAGYTATSGFAGRAAAAALGNVAYLSSGPIGIILGAITVVSTINSLWCAYYCWYA